jgi:hypothetical protein
MLRGVVPCDVKPCMAQARFYFSRVIRPHKEFPKYEAISVKQTEFYYYFFYPIDSALNNLMPNQYESQHKKNHE